MAIFPMHRCHIKTNQTIDKKSETEAGCGLLAILPGISGTGP